MYGSGAGIGMEATVVERRQIRKGRVLALAACIVAVAGTTMTPTAGWQIVTAATLPFPPTVEAPTEGSALSAVQNRNQSYAVNEIRFYHMECKICDFA